MVRPVAEYAYYQDNFGRLNPASFGRVNNGELSLRHRSHTGAQKSINQSFFLMDYSLAKAPLSIGGIFQNYSLGPFINFNTGNLALNYHWLKDSKLNINTALGLGFLNASISSTPYR